LAFSLTAPGLVVDEPTQSLVWNQRPESVQFGVSLPEGIAIGAVIGSVRVAQESVPVGTIKFKIEVDPARKALPPEPVGEIVRNYSLAFISYASRDREKVLARVQMLKSLGVRYFQDILHLSPGERWERSLYLKIDECDLFLLFWSQAAKDSEWVLREVRYAITRKRGIEDAPPDIVPVIIDGPPAVPPPHDLAHLHFNDPLVYFLAREGCG